MAKEEPEESDFLLRGLPADLKKTLQEQAKANGRSLNTEIIYRLQRSLEPPRRRNVYKLEEERAEYRVDGETEAAMLSLFRRLGPEKQLALLSLFK